MDAGDGAGGRGRDWRCCRARRAAARAGPVVLGRGELGGGPDAVAVVAGVRRAAGLSADDVSSDRFGLPIALSLVFALFWGGRILFVFFSLFVFVFVASTYPRWGEFTNMSFYVGCKKGEIY